ncbi:hypothetical protein N802_06260 [Knoellia sinensis KCTC 19936]|uniref:Uncharacterized protein n=2 Tax=Knoellia TaxID=136099 RepID=A0A0A0J285_9MICO|nr:hypothetical protein N802_06260 [Knoellia sinensis KCTC 19936]
MATALLVLAAGALTGCGESVQSAPNPQRPSPTHQVVEPDALVAGRGMLMQKSADGPIEFCTGAVAESYPPQCGGPRIVGDVDWNVLQTERSGGVTWTNGDVWGVGRFDASGGEGGTFTLDRPLSQRPPEGHVAPSAQTPDFPQLCDDPYAGGGRPGAGSAEQQNALSIRLEEVDGYIGSWVSDGQSMFNVLVTGDASQVHKELRAIWPGGLCVEQRDAATLKDVQAAQDALAKALPGLLMTGGRGDGTLEVQVTLLDRATLDKVLETVEPWLEPQDLRMASTFQPLTG